MPSLPPTTKAGLIGTYPPQNRTTGPRLERVRAGQGPVPLAAAGATQRRHKTGIASSPGPFGGRSRSCIARSTALRLRLQHLTAIPEPGRRCRHPLAPAGQNTNPGSINWTSRILRGRKTRACAPQGQRSLRSRLLPFAVTPPALRKRLFALHPRPAQGTTSLLISWFSWNRPVSFQPPKTGWAGTYPSQAAPTGPRWKG